MHISHSLICPHGVIQASKWRASHVHQDKTMSRQESSFTIRGWGGELKLHFPTWFVKLPPPQPPPPCRISGLQPHFPNIPLLNHDPQTWTCVPCYLCMLVTYVMDIAPFWQCTPFVKHFHKPLGMYSVDGGGSGGMIPAILPVLSFISNGKGGKLQLEDIFMSLEWKKAGKNTDLGA